MIRPMSSAPGERSFVARSWVESYASSDMAKMLTYAGCCPWMQGAKWNATLGYWTTWNALVNVLLDRCEVTVSDDGLISGFVVHEPWGDSTAVHYVYVRLTRRAQGVARELLATLPSGPTLFTHRSRGVREVPSHWRFSMAPLFGVLDERGHMSNNTGKGGSCFRCGGVATKMQERARPPCDRRLCCDNADCNKPRNGEVWISYPLKEAPRVVVRR